MLQVQHVLIQPLSIELVSKSVILNINQSFKLKVIITSITQCRWRKKKGCNAVPGYCALQNATRHITGLNPDIVLKSM